MTTLRGWRLRAVARTLTDATPSSAPSRDAVLDPGAAPASDLAGGGTGGKLRWPDVAPPLDLSIDYSRATAVARWRQEHPTARPSARGRREDADELVPFWTAPPGYCRVCGQPCPTRRHRWHDTCVAEYNALASGQGFRQAVWNRDHGRCAACPPDASPQPRHNGQLCTGCGRTTPPGCVCWTCTPLRLRAPGHPDPPPSPELLPVGWDADHIVPLIDGGPNTMDNAQTLCLPHHRAKTAAEARARAATRRATR